MATEYEELKITVSLDDNASGPLGTLRTNLQQLANIPHPAGSGHEHLDPAIAKTAEYVKHVLALGRSFDVLKTFMNPVTLGLAVVGYEFYRGIQALRDYTVEIGNLSLAAKQAGISFSEMKNITSQLEASGISVDKVTESVKGLNESIASLSRPFSQLRVDLMEKAGPAGAQGIQQWIDKILAAKDETDRFNVAMEGANNVFKNSLAAGDSEITARSNQLKFLRDIGMDPAMIRHEQALAQMSKEQRERYERLSALTGEFLGKWGEIHRTLGLTRDIFLSEALSPGGPFAQLTQLVLDLTQEIETTWEDIDTQINQIKLPAWLTALFSPHPYQATMKGLFGIENAPTLPGPALFSQHPYQALFGGGAPAAGGAAGGAAGAGAAGGAGGWQFYGPGVPGLAEGGIINEPTVAMLGERGPEAVMPLSNTILTNNTKDNAEATDENTATINELTAILQQWTETMGGSGFAGGGGSSGGAGATGSWDGGGTTSGGTDSSGQVGTKGAGGETKGITGPVGTKGEYRPYNAAVPGGLGKEVANRYSAAGTPVDTRTATQVSLSNGVKFTTNSANAPQVEGFLNEMIAMGAPITQAASFGYRGGNASAHPHGLATDVNQSGRGVLNNPAFGKWIQQHQEQINQAEVRWNQVGGEHWKSPDTGHWTMGRQMSQDELTAAAKASKEAIDKSKLVKMAEGGVVTQPTMALIGEAGPEMVIPLGKGADPAKRERETMARLQASGVYNNPISEALAPVESRFDKIAETYRNAAKGNFWQRQLGGAKTLGQAALLPFDVGSGLINATAGAAVTGAANVLGGDMSRDTGNKLANIGALALSAPKLIQSTVASVGEVAENLPALATQGTAALPAVGRAGYRAASNIHKLYRDIELNPLPDIPVGEQTAQQPSSFTEPFGGELGVGDRALVGRTPSRAAGGGEGVIKVKHEAPAPAPGPSVPVFDGFELQGQTQMHDASQGPPLNHQLSPVEVRGVSHLAQSK